VDQLPTADIPEDHLSPDALVGKSFLEEPDEDEPRLHAKTKEKLKTHFSCANPDHKMDHLRRCHDPLENPDERSFKQDGEDLFRLVSATVHQGPLMPKDTEYMGSARNTLINWEDGSNTYEPLQIMRKDHPDLCAQYALDNNLLDKDGWKQFRRKAKKKTLHRKMNQKKKQKHFVPIFLHCVEPPQALVNARRFDDEDGNTTWVDSEHLELKQLLDYEFAVDRDKMEACDPTLQGYTDNKNGFESWDLCLFWQGDTNMIPTKGE
jgi:hypothetical protein